MVRLRTALRELGRLLAYTLTILLILWTVGAMAGMVAAGFCSVACSR